MKKTKFIALTLVIAVVLMGAGYAAWTDTLTINNNAYTGNLNVVFEEGSSLNRISEDPYVEVEVNPIDDQTIGVNISNIYPGAGGGFTYMIKNRGSIPAKFDNITYENIVDTDKLDANNILTYLISLQDYDKDNDPISTDSRNGSANNVAGMVGRLQDHLANWYGPDQPLILQPGEYVLFTNPNPSGDSVMAGYFASMHLNETGYEDADLSFVLKVNFKQFNK